MVNYVTVRLTVDTATAADAIAARVDDVRRTREGDTVRFRTNAGINLATLSPAGSGSVLRYRTSLIGPHLSHARTTARAVRAAVDPYRAD